MAVEIFGVDKNSLAGRAGIKPHDKLISINGHDITDILDFRFYETNTHLHVVYETAEGERREEKFVKPQYGALGLAFETYLMDRQRSAATSACSASLISCRPACAKRSILRMMMTAFRFCSATTSR